MCSERSDQGKCVWVRKGKQGNLADQSFHFQFYPILSRLELIRGICLIFLTYSPCYFEANALRTSKNNEEIKMCDIFNNSKLRVG